MKFLKSITVLIFCSNLLFSQETQKDSVLTHFKLGEVQVLGKTGFINMSNELNVNAIQSIGAKRVTEALNLLPGVTLTESGTRNEGMVYVRGFDQRQVPVFVDGIPVYVPFDGFVDLNRLQTAGVSKIQVNKGFTSLLLGGNTMGGAINIISSQPVHKLEVGVDVSTLWNTTVNVGSRFNKWYFKVGASYLNRNDYRLPSSFNAQEDSFEKTKRANSDSEDLQFHSKIGFTPATDHEYTIGYNMIRSEKGVPIYLGEAGKKNYWRFTNWNKDQLYVFTKTPINQKVVVENRVYFDSYYNFLQSFDDHNYNSQNSKKAFNSYYDDYSIGGSSIFSWTALENNTLKWGITGKYDLHQSYDEGETIPRQKEYLLSASVEDTWHITPQITLLAGVGYYKHQGLQIEAFEGGSMVNYPTNNDGYFNYQLATIYDINNTNNLQFLFSKNARFASLKERYSYKRGKSMPNINLGTEQSYNLDISYNGRYKKLSWHTSAYYNFLVDVIQEVTGVDKEDPLVWQLQNTGRANFRGVELGANYETTHWGAWVNYTLIDRVNITDRNILFTDIPKHKLNISAYAREYYSAITFRANTTVNSKRLTTSDGKLYAPSYTIYNVSAERIFFKSLLAKFSIYNILDKLYYISEGYPHEGRRFDLCLSYNFKIK